MCITNWKDRTGFYSHLFPSFWQHESWTLPALIYPQMDHSGSWWDEVPVSALLTQKILLCSSQSLQLSHRVCTSKSGLCCLCPWPLGSSCPIAKLTPWWLNQVVASHCLKEKPNISHLLPHPLFFFLMNYFFSDFTYIVTSQKVFQNWLGSVGKNSQKLLQAALLLKKIFSMRL